MNNSQISHDDIERMRQMLAQHDANNHVGIKEFDLNNPPKVPYRFQELPRTMYHHAKQTSRTAFTEQDVDEAILLGWVKEPFPAVTAAPEIEDSASAQEIAALDAKARLRRK